MKFIKFMSVSILVGQCAVETSFSDDLSAQIQSARSACSGISDTMTNLKKMAGINTEGRFIGMDNTIEIWSRERAEQPFMEAEDFSKALQDTLGNDSMWHFMEGSNQDE